MATRTEYFADETVPLDLSDPWVVNKYHSQLVTDRRAALLNGFTANLRFDLDVVIPPSNPHPRSRHPPALPSNVPITFRLSEPLQSGLDENSQVWTAVAELPGGARTTVVFKIIQPSMCEYPEDPRESWDLYVFPQSRGKAETWAYERLAHKQGHLIPYFLGMHPITAPCGEQAWVLVLEYIRGPSLVSYLKSATPNTQADTCNVFKLCMQTLTDFMDDGWCNFDVVPRNIIVAGTAGDRTVVLIDMTPTVRFDSAFSQLVGAKYKLYREMCDALEDPTGVEQAIENVRSELAAARELVLHRLSKT
ncbi:hypothetical protein FB45DRAFT_850265 [Roridomyces roridus]|uniref:Protein kinase domain-containing protein n=1 Tax=Roridomyces roridus TaxID=1738132 RepID=A0AAD7AYN8_9AGAR|nr:hypothetical protein FB45DRAFT_850265 [Roridomyces roridus]